MKIDDKRFWEMVDVSEPENCWGWKGYKLPGGYGILHRRKISPIPIRSNRYSFYLKHGRWPKNLACHHCDNPACCNPNHIFDGTAQINSDDKIRRGRARYPDQRGMKNPLAKLTEHQVLEIRRLRADGMSNKQLAKIYKMTFQTISAINLRKIWKHI